MMHRAFRLSLAGSAGLICLASGWSSASAAARTAVVDGAPWSLVQDHSDRSCPLTLRFDAAGAAGALAMPAGCRRALPGMTKARSWSIDADGSIQLRDATGQSLLTLGRQGDGVWHGDDESGRSYTLTPPDAAAAAARSDLADQDPVALATTQVITPEPPAVLDRSVVQLAAASSAKPAAPDGSSATGRYAVMRGDRDTGCMVTLESGKGKARARLAPACRDQGITIFDPVSWQMKGSEILLTARKGHSISLTKDDSGVWVKMPKDAKALGLKPL